jgi:hypothetical protein
LAEAAFFILSQKKTSIPEVVNKTVSGALSFVAPVTGFFEGYSTLDKLEFAEEELPNDGGTSSFRYTIKGFYPAAHPLFDDNFEDIAAHRLIVLCEDNSGLQRLVGNIEKGMRFKAAWSSGAKAGDARGYNFEFSGEFDIRAPYYGTVPSIQTSCADAVAVLKDTAGNTLSTTSIASGASEDIEAPDATAVIKDSAGATLKTELIPSGASEDIAIDDSTVNVKKSNGNLISAVAVKAEATEDYTVADSNVSNSDDSYNVNVKATESLSLSDITLIIKDQSNNTLSTSSEKAAVNITKSVTIPATGSLSVGLSTSTPTISQVVTITATPSGITPTSYTFFVPRQEIYLDTVTDILLLRTVYRAITQVGNTYAWTVQNCDPSFSVYVTATDGTDTVVGSTTGTMTDSDHSSFISATGIADNTIINANLKHTLFLKLKSIWTQLDAIHPFVGGTATTHKYNAKNPADTDAAFRLEFNGGWTHNSNGAIPNGTNAYARTFWIPNTQASINGICFGWYSRTNNTTGTQVHGVIATQVVQHNITGRNFIAGIVGNILSYAAPATTQRFFFANRQSDSNFVALRDGNSLAGEDGTSNVLPSTYDFFWAARNNTGGAEFYSIHNLAYGCLGDGLTSQQIIELTAAVNQYQTDLSRNV